MNLSANCLLISPVLHNANDYGSLNQNMVSAGSSDKSFTRSSINFWRLDSSYNSLIYSPIQINLSKIFLHAYFTYPHQSKRYAFGCEKNSLDTAYYTYIIY